MFRFVFGMAQVVQALKFLLCLTEILPHQLVHTGANLFTWIKRNDIYSAVPSDFPSQTAVSF